MLNVVYYNMSKGCIKLAYSLYPVDTDSGKESSPSVDGIRQWLDAVDQCPTYSRFNVLMGMLECCVKWEKSAENAVCNNESVTT